MRKNNFPKQKIKNKMHKRNLIYIAEDQNNLRSSVSEVIKETFQDYSVKSFDNGASLYKNILENNRNLELVLTDNKMPLIDGIKVIKKCSKLYPEVDFILMSGNKLNAKAINAGAKEFLKKPFSVKDLIQTLSKYLIKK